MKNKLTIWLALSLALVCSFVNVSGCPVCQRQQPKLLKGIGHGSGPEGDLDYVIIGIISLIVIFTLFFSVSYLLRPGEKNENHIKRFILNQ